MQELKEDNFRETLPKVEVNQLTGNYELSTNLGRHVLTLIHPVITEDEPLSEEKEEQFRADLRLYQNAGAVYDCLEQLSTHLKALKEGKITIFNFPLEQMIKDANLVLRKASNN